MTKVFVDGHNALFALRLRGADHDACRRALLVRVRARLRDAVVYFDGRGSPRDLPRVFRQEGVRVTYCKDEEADHEILEDVRDAQQPRRILVVTNDRELAGRCRQVGARVSSVKDALGDLDEDDVPPSALAQHRRRRPRVPGVPRATGRVADPVTGPVKGHAAGHATGRATGGRAAFAPGDAALTPADFDLPDLVDPDDPRGI